MFFANNYNKWFFKTIQQKFYENFYDVNLSMETKQSIFNQIPKFSISFHFKLAQIKEKFLYFSDKAFKYLRWNMIKFKNKKLSAL